MLVNRDGVLHALIRRRTLRLMVWLWSSNRGRKEGCWPCASAHLCPTTARLHVRFGVGNSEATDTHDVDDYRLARRWPNPHGFRRTEPTARLTHGSHVSCGKCDRRWSCVLVLHDDWFSALRHFGGRLVRDCGGRPCSQLFRRSPCRLRPKRR